jgi:hypothetical protein
LDSRQSLTTIALCGGQPSQQAHLPHVALGGGAVPCTRREVDLRWIRMWM